MSDPDAQRFLEAYWRLRRHFVAEVGPRLEAAHGLELSRVFLLHYVAASDLAPSEIAAAMLLPPHAISRRLMALERSGYLERSLDPDDARRRVLNPTPAGLRLIAAARESLGEAVETLLARLEPEHRQSFLAGLEALTGTGCGEGERRAERTGETTEPPRSASPPTAAPDDPDSATHAESREAGEQP